MNRDYIDTIKLYMEWMETSWDRAVFGTPVLHISKLNIYDADAGSDFRSFESTRDAMGAGMVTCRIADSQLSESIFLEERGFRFVEMVFYPEMNLDENQPCSFDTDFLVRPAEVADVSIISDIAGRAFTNERFHVDPRVHSEQADQRYRNWVESSLPSSTQQLFAVCEGDVIVAFFVTELMPDGTCYWHLNAVRPEFQGKGYGTRVWQTMIGEARNQGARKIRSCFTTRNLRVLGLYAKLGFRMAEQRMTLHWVR